MPPDSPSRQSIDPGNALRDGQWHHVAGSVVDGQLESLWIDNNYAGNGMTEVEAVARALRVADNARGREDTWDTWDEGTTWDETPEDAQERYRIRARIFLSAYAAARGLDG